MKSCAISCKIVLSCNYVVCIIIYCSLQSSRSWISAGFLRILLNLVTDSAFQDRWSRGRGCSARRQQGCSGYFLKKWSGLHHGLHQTQREAVFSEGTWSSGWSYCHGGVRHVKWSHVSPLRSRCQSHLPMRQGKKTFLDLCIRETWNFRKLKLLTFDILLFWKIFFEFFWIF